MTLMQQEPPAEDTPSIADQLHDVVDEMLSPYGKLSNRNAPFSPPGSPPFDTSKPNQHDSKAQFNREQDAASKAHELLKELSETLLPFSDEVTREELISGLFPRVDEKLRVQMRRKDVKDPVDLVKRNVADVGAMYSLLILSVEFRAALKERLKELREQEERFWNVKHRPPDYYAREIALRLARLFAQETGKKPTFGTGAVDGEPSTDFVRALAKTFTILDITVQNRGPAEWAIGQITDEDLQPKRNAFAGLMGAPTPQNHGRTLPALVEMFSGKSEKS